MTAILAHEIKNPLAGIRGAAQLLEQTAGPDDVTLTRLIVGECDRVKALIDRMQTLSESRPLQSEALNIHEVMDQVKRLAQASFGQRVRIVELYDPSLPPVQGDRNQLTDAIVNIVKNAADAVAETANPEIQLMTAYRQGVHWAVEGRGQRAALPLEVTIADNGPGIPEDLKASLFEPFVTGKAGGTGLGLALAAKIIADHGGVIECESAARRTAFRILLPANRN
jgi:two-component system nitrogen regulation sensor histidine kinase GlnL